MVAIVGITIKKPEWDLLLPVSISFYTLQSLGYLIDIYRGKVHAEKNIFRYALFVAFFPVVMSGTIERAENLLKQLQGEIYLKVESLRYGLLSLAWGLFLKLVMAVIVNSVIEDWRSWKGCEIALAVVIFGMQIYCDFSGYSYMAVGAAKILGIDIMKNFSAPYPAENVKEFWRRWHISLTSWFTDYIYIPLGGNRKGTVRKYINTLIVFGVSGLWHGAGLNFLAWGLLNGFYLVIYDFYSQARNKGCCVCQNNTANNKLSGARICKSVLTFLATDFAWFFFVMPDMGDAVAALAYSLHNFKFPWLFSEGIFNMFPGKREFFNILISLAVMFGVDNLEYQGKDFRDVVFGQNRIVRWMVYLFLIIMIILWGAYGEDYQQKAFIKRAESLLIPYIIWRLIENIKFDGGIGIDFQSLGKLLVGQSENCLWFLIVLFGLKCMQILYWFLQEKSKKNSLFLIFCGVFYISEITVRKIFDNKWIVILSVICYLAVFQAFDFNNPAMITQVIRIFLSICVIVVCCKCQPRWQKNCKWKEMFCSFGRHSLEIYLLHGSFVNYAHLLKNTNHIWFSGALIAVLSVRIAYVCTIIANVINKSKYLRKFLFGKRALHQKA